MKQIYKISVLHVVLLSMTVIGLKNHVSIIPPLIDTVKRDAWMSVLLSAAIIFPWLFLLVYLQKASQRKSMRNWLEEGIGKTGTNVLLTIIAFYLILMAAFTMVETIQWVNTMFLPRSSFLLLLIIFIILCILLAMTNIQTIVILNVFVLFFVVVFGFFVAFVNIQVKDYELLRPFLEHGFHPVVKGFVFPASGLTELLMFLFIQDQIKKPIKWFHFVIMLIILVGLTMGPLIGAITEFGPTEAAKLLYPAYEEWGLVSIGRFIEHMDFFSIYQWLTGTFIRVGFILYVVSQLLVRRRKKSVWILISPLFFFCCILLSRLDDSQFVEFKGGAFLISTFLFFFILSFVFLFISIFTRKKKTKASHMGEEL
ncbi:endospore germination permease [Chungangia koreensis]|uniref:Endospore germination permease n=1 Tax=Chungangia koreensis TaxID=752657 RepID=A0ABV8X6W2_9LACT